MSPSVRKRLRKVLFAGLVLLIVGLAYAAFVRLTGFAIPCPFHLVTGLDCPGCGITRMCMALLRGDIGAAYAFNRGLFLAAPFLALLLGIVLYRYVWDVRGKGTLWKVEHGLTLVLLTYMLGWGVLRNLLHI